MAHPNNVIHRPTDARQFWPRKAADRILQLDNRAAMQAAIEQVPEDYRDWVKNLINDAIRKAGGLANLKINMDAAKLKQEKKY